MVGVLFIGDVSAIAVAKFLCEAKVDDIYEMLGMAGAHDEIGGLDVAVNEVV